MHGDPLLRIAYIVDTGENVRIHVPNESTYSAFRGAACDLNQMRVKLMHTSLHFMVRSWTSELLKEVQTLILIVTTCSWLSLFKGDVCKMSLMSGAPCSSVQKWYRLFSQASWLFQVYSLSITMYFGIVCST